jgi:hypothetical protein
VDDNGVLGEPGQVGDGRKEDDGGGRYRHLLAVLQGVESRKERVLILSYCADLEISKVSH